ncbi:protein kinase domain-containing protein [Sorangium sp. So ce854]|uniref:protein kinase domain-containing protein n=1 Tax=Sorangium sp. So ce854 TaxID=3133322 RepID=UPI003F618717
MAEPLIAGKYMLIRHIGGGGMGQIWETEDLRLQRRIALKLMSAEQVESPESCARFEREAKAIAQLRNQHVVHIYDYGIDHGIDEERPYIAMELLEGEDLQRRLDRVRRLPLPAVASIVTQAARGLAAAHAAGIVHRDLKPGNVFLARAEAGEVVKLLDFGVVTMLSGTDDLRLTGGGGLIGTPTYMSPEQMRGAVVDHRSDLWSLGVLAYCTLTGELPFSGQTLGGLVVGICTEPFPPPSSLVPGLSPELDRFFERALAKDPTQRFRSAREMAAALSALAAGNERRPAKILIADDEPDVSALIKQCFRRQIREGIYNFVFAGDGESALAELRNHPDTDVVLTDINMPRMDGLTLLPHIGDVTPHARAVVVSAYGDMQNIRTAMNRGAFDFLVKPIDFKDLELTIEKTLKQVRELRDNSRSSRENELLRTFASPLAVERLRSPDGFGACEVVEGTVAFLDLAGFHDAARDKRSEETVRMLNANLDVIALELSMRGGIIDRFLGDCVVAVFRGPSHVASALDACLVVRAQLETLARRAGETSAFVPGISIGVATGELIIAEVGSRSCRRLDCTVLGEVVSVAAQLQAAAERNQILVSGEVHARAAGFECAPRGQRPFVGARGPVQVVEVLSRTAGAQGPVGSAQGEVVTLEIRSSRASSPG